MTKFNKQGRQTCELAGAGVVASRPIYSAAENKREKKFDK